MIPLSYFLMAWLFLYAIFALVSVITLLTYLRFSVSGFMTYATSAIFLAVSALTSLAVAFYFMSVDWSQAIGLFSGLTPRLPF